jgi:geranylgeranyl diphosphate synthase type II
LTASEREFLDFLRGVRPEIERELDRTLPAVTQWPARLHEAMRYSVFAGGKRLRPALVLLAGELLGAARARLLAGAAAVELIHTYSLIHDDLPALDDDDLRRGRATLHREFDEATAILAGDALLTLGLARLGSEPAEADGATRSRAVTLIGEAIGTGGMIGGQVEDMETEAAWPDDPGAALERIHRGKTGALLTGCLRLGGVYAGCGEAEDNRLRRLGERVGLLFQIRDDLLDVEGTAGQLGKTPGKDARAAKLTYPGLYGVEESRARVRELAGEAADLVSALPGDAKLLTSLIVFLSQRTS